MQGGQLPWGCAWALLCVVRWGRCTFCSGGWAVAVGWTPMCLGGGGGGIAVVRLRWVFVGE